MLDSAPAIFVALEGSGLGQMIRQSRWLYMTANVGHIVSLVVFAGAVAVLDLRMAGAFAATSPGNVLSPRPACRYLGLPWPCADGHGAVHRRSEPPRHESDVQLKLALIALGCSTSRCSSSSARAGERSGTADTIAPGRAARRSDFDRAVDRGRDCGRSIAYF